ncbi:MAG: type II toxin-antitoxin system VapC family toxin [Candidatus Brocadiia bacterium]
MNVFLDTSVLMDVLLERQPFAPDAQRLWFLAERAKIEGAVSALSFPNVYYIVRKMRGPDFATTMLRAMRDTFHIVACDEQILQQAIDAKFSDFEDAVQYFSALRVNAVCMVTRNPRHFPKSSLPIFTPHEFFSVHSFD